MLVTRSNSIVGAVEKEILPDSLTTTQLFRFKSMQVV